MMMQTLDKQKIQAQVDRWNETCPSGTRVSVKGRTEIKTTRTKAMVLFDQKAVIYLEGHNGYFDLEDVSPANEKPKPQPEPARPSSVATPVQTGLCYMFPGQGSQKVGMGEALFDAFPDLTRAADGVLGYSIKELCLRDPDRRLDQTQFTQPALYVVNALSFLNEKGKGGLAPAFVLGHSLGEYSALFAAGVFDFETGLRLVQKRGALMAEAKGGGMAAIIGLGMDRVRQILGESGLGGLDLANLNAPTQLVVSGPRDDITRAQVIFEQAGAKMYVPLKVSGAFHSRYMKDAREAFRAYLDAFRFNPPSTPVISNVEAKPYDPQRISALLADQLISPVRWTESVQHLVTQGVETFQEIGPGNVLAGLVRKIRTAA